MLKIASEGLMPRLVACVQASSSAQNACQRLAPLAVSATQKFLSQSQTTNKIYTVKDHYEFDQKVINSDTPVIVNFHAEWCDPCKILTPKMTELLENSKEIDLAIIDVENNTELVETFEVKAVPAVLAFRNGVVVDKFIGLVDANSIESLIDKLKRKNQQNQSTTESTTEPETK